MLQIARDDALEILKDDPALSSSENRALRDALKAEFGETLRLAQVG